MTKFAPLLIFLFITQLGISQHRPLFRIFEKDKTGYINSSGVTVIPPIYHNGFDFAEGLAAVRENGLYGFIDTNGKYSITPQYDYATYFVNGITLVYKQGRSFFIDKTGKVVLPDVYRSMKFIDNRKAVITTKAGRYGIIDVPTGQLLLDTLYGEISDFNKGVALITQYNTAKVPSSQGTTAVINAAGNFIVPFGKFIYIHDFHDGYANVSLDTNWTDGVIDVTGKLLKGAPRIDNKLPPYNKYFDVPVSTFYTRLASGNVYDGLININGDTILNDTNYRAIVSYSSGRIVTKDQHDNYCFLDKNCKLLEKKSFKYTAGFVKNYAIVETDKGMGIIDTNVRFVVKPVYNDIRFPDSTADYFFFAVPDRKENNSRKYGIANFKNEVIIQPILDEYVQEGFKNGLLYVNVNNLATYINKQGKIVWQEQPAKTREIKAMDIDFQTNSVYFTAPALDDPDYFNYGSSERLHTRFKKITAAEQFPQNEFIFKFDTTHTDTLGSYFANRLIVGNSTKDTIKLLSISGVTMQPEALDEDGNWKKIENFTWPTHTNGYSIVSLNPGAYLPFKIIRYAGNFKTKLRFKLWYEDKDGKVQTILSNTINTFLNKAQFWRDYSYPAGVYDPIDNNNRTVDMSTIKKDDYYKIFSDLPNHN